MRCTLAAAAARFGEATTWSVSTSPAGGVGNAYLLCKALANGASLMAVLAMLYIFYPAVKKLLTRLSVLSSRVLVCHATAHFPKVISQNANAWQSQAGK